MAAILKLRRGTSFSSPQISEPFFDTTKGTLLIGTGSNEYITLARLSSGSYGKVNTGDFWVDGDVTASNLNLSGDITARNTTLSGDIIIGGNIFLGDSVANDNITILASLSGSLIPSESAQYDLGSDIRKWNELWVVSASIDNIEVPGSGILSSSVTDFITYSSSVDERLDNAEWTGSDHEDRVVLLEWTGSNHETRLDYIETTFSTSVDLRLDNAEWTGSDHETRLDYLEGDFSTSLDSRLDYLEGPFSTSVDGRLDELEGPFSTSVDERLDNAEWTGSNHETRLDEIEGPFSQSVDLRLDNAEWTGSDHETRLDELEGPFSTSVDERLDNAEWTGSNQEGRLDELETTFSSSVDSRLDYLEGPFSTSVDSRLDDAEWTGSNQEARLDELETTFSSSVDERLDDLEWTGSNHEDRIDLLEATGSDHETRLDYLEGDFSTSLDSRLDYLEGDFSTSLDSQLDEIHAYTSSLKTAIDVNGSNLIVLGDLTVQGTQTSLNTTEVLVEDILLALASGSTTSVEADGGGIFISGANASMTWNHSDQLIEFNTKVSSSVGFKGDGSELTDIQHGNIDFGGSNIVSGSDQVSGSIYGDISGDVTVNNLGVASISSNVIVNADVKSDAGIVYTKLNLNGSNLVSGSEQVSGSIYGDISGDVTVNNLGVASISSGVIVNADVKSDAGIAYTKLNLNGSNIFSQSAQVNADEITNFDSNVKDKLNQDNVHSGSYLGTATTTNLSEGTNKYYTDARVKTKLNLEGVLSGSSQVTASLDDRYLNTNGDSVVSGSDQVSGSIYSGISGVINVGPLGVSNIVNGSIVDADVNTNAGIAYTKISFNGSNIVSGSEQVTQSLDTRYEPIANGTHTLVSSSAISSTSQGTVKLTTNGTAGSDIDLGLETTDSPTFSGLTLTGLSSLGASAVNAVISGSGGTLGYRALGTAAFFNVSASVGDDPNSIPTNQAVSDALIAAGAGDITAVNDSSLYSPTTTGILHTGDGTDVAGVYGTQGNVVLAIDTGSLHFTDGVVGALPNGTVSGSSQILDGSGILSSSNETFAEFSSSVSESFAGLSTDYNDLINIPVGIVSSSTQISNYNTFLEINGDNVFSQSAQVNADSITNFDTNVKDKMNADGVISGSDQILLGSGIVSSSTQISNYNTFLEINGDNVVSSSQQISDYNTFLEINGDNVVSSSNQIKNLGFVDLTSTQTISGTKTFDDIVVNGTGSFAYITSVSGTAKIIGDNYIILNNDTPTQRFAGVAVYDSGSAGVTASLEFDGQTNDWFYEYSDDGGVTTDHGVVMFGPEYSGKGSPTYLTNNRVPKSNGNHHLLDSNISDTGTTITLGSAVDVSGVTNFNDTTQSTSKTTGAVIIDGGVGIAKTLNVGEDVVAYASSDERLKDNIIPISNPLDKINQIGGYSFTWNEEKQHIYKGKDYGVIAQEIEKILPELVDTRENGYKAVKYDKLVSLLIEGIKELSEEVKELKNKLG